MSEFHKRKMKDGEGTFLAKKTDGGGWYELKFADGETMRHLASVIEELSEEIVDDSPSKD
jgi:hypothetical protein